MDDDMSEIIFIDHSNPPNDKFQTCKHRSSEIISKKVKVCCNNWQDMQGFECPVKGYFPLNGNHCANCEAYQSR